MTTSLTSNWYDCEGKRRRMKNMDGERTRHEEMSTHNPPGPACLGAPQEFPSV